MMRCMLAVLIMCMLPLTVTAHFFEAVDMSQPLGIRFLADNTYRLYGGESRLYFYGRAICVDDTVSLYMGCSDELVILLKAEGDGYRVDKVSPSFFENVSRWQNIVFARNEMPQDRADVVGSYQLGKAFSRTLVLNEDGRYVLWRPPVFSYLPTGSYEVDGHELVLFEENGWELMRLVIQQDGFVVPEISDYAARHLFLTTGDVFVPLLTRPLVEGIYTDGDLRLELGTSMDADDSMYTLYRNDEPLAYHGGYFAYNDRLFLTLGQATHIGYAGPHISFEFVIDDGVLVPLSIPHDDAMEEWAEVRLKKQE